MKTRYWILIALITIVIVSAIFLLNRTSQQLRVHNETACTTDSDCVIAPKRNTNNLCCATCGGEAINNDAQKARNVWWTENCTTEECPVFDCYEEKLPIPRCIDNQCVIEWTARTS